MMDGGYATLTAGRRRSVNGNIFSARYCLAADRRPAACLSLLSPSLRISFRQNGEILMKEFIVSEGLPA